MNRDISRMRMAARQLLFPQVILGMVAAGFAVAAATSNKSGASTGAATQGGILTRSLAVGPASADLSQVGNEDWAVWGFASGGTSTSLAPDVRKSGRERDPAT
jgi:hypothetical protein